MRITRIVTTVFKLVIPPRTPGSVLIPRIKFSEGDFPAPSTTVPYPEAKSIRVSDRYYATAQYLPPRRVSLLSPTSSDLTVPLVDTHVIWGLNFGQRNGSAAICAARAILDAFSSPAFVNANITLDALEIGNEPDLYMNNGLRPSSYGSPQYVEECVPDLIFGFRKL